MTAPCLPPHILTVALMSCGLCGLAHLSAADEAERRKVEPIKVDPHVCTQPSAGDRSIFHDGGFEHASLRYPEKQINSDDHADQGWVVHESRSPWKLDPEARTLTCETGYDLSEFNAVKAVQIVTDNAQSQGSHILHVDTRNPTKSTFKVRIYGSHEGFDINPFLSRGPVKNRKEPVGTMLAAFRLDSMEDESWHHYEVPVDLGQGYRFIVVTLEPPRYTGTAGVVTEIDNVWLASGAAPVLTDSSSQKGKMADLPASSPSRQVAQTRPKPSTTLAVDLFEEALPPYSPAFQSSSPSENAICLWQFQGKEAGPAYWSVHELDVVSEPFLKMTVKALDPVDLNLKIVVLTDEKNRLEITRPIDLAAGESETLLVDLKAMKRTGFPNLEEIEEIELYAEPRAGNDAEQLLIMEAGFVRSARD